MALSHHKDRRKGYPFQLKRPNTELPTAILLRTFFNKKEFKYGIGYSIYAELWDKNTFRPTTDKNIIKKYEKTNPHLRIDLQNIGIRLENIEREIKTYINNIESERTTFDISQLKDRLDTNIKKIDKSEQQVTIPLLLPFMEETIIGMEKGTVLIGHGKRKNMRYATGTIKNYKGLYVQWEIFEKAIHRKIRFHEVTVDLFNKLINHFNNKGLSANTIARHIRYLKVIMQRSYDRGLHENMAFRGSSFLAPETETFKIALNAEDVRKLENAQLSDRPHYELILDVFLIGIYTALRYSDYSRIKPEHITSINNDGNKINVLKIIARKTGSSVTIPIKPQLEKILKKYDYKLPKTYPQKLNDRIKIIAKEVGINEPIPIEKKKGGLKVKTTVPKYQLITSHTARRTGATLMYNSGIPPSDIMKITGHKTEKSFRKYLKISNDEAAIKMADRAYFKEGKKEGKIINL